ncbi:MAG: hypothetical protein R6W99_07915 [Clostridia bacterium]|jgi:hypothetical protein
MENQSQNNQCKQWEEKAKASDSAERKEDYIVLAISLITVALVLTNVVGPNFFKSMFF